jgi:hypothetical protein
MNRMPSCVGLAWHQRPGLCLPWHLQREGNALTLAGLEATGHTKADGGRVARPFGSALTDPGRRLSRTRLFPEVTPSEPLTAPIDR